MIYLLIGGITAPLPATKQKMPSDFTKKAVFWFEIQNHQVKIIHCQSSTSFIDFLSSISFLLKNGKYFPSGNTNILELYFFFSGLLGDLCTWRFRSAIKPLYWDNSANPLMLLLTCYYTIVETAYQSKGPNTSAWKSQFANSYFD